MNIWSPIRYLQMILQVPLYIYIVHQYSRLPGLLPLLDLVDDVVGHLTVLPHTQHIVPLGTRIKLELSHYMT